MNKVLAVVVTYNRKEMLKKCLFSLKKQTFEDLDILVINNASTDGTAELLSESGISSLTVLHLEKNLGGAGGFNAGMRYGAEHGYDYCWIMDDDTFPNEDALEKLMEADQILHGEYGFLSSAVLWTDGKECKMNRQKIKKNFYEDVHLLEAGLIRVEQATFVSMLIPVSSIIEVGLPITEFFIWGDDIEYSRRMSVRCKMNCYLAGKSQVVHAMKENNGSSIALDDSARISRYNYAFRNENYLYRKEGVRGFVYYIAKCGLNVLRIIRFSQDGKLKRTGIILKNMILGLFFNPEIEYVSKK